MKVKELIRILQAMDQEALVVVSGYEGGVNESKTAEEYTIALDVNPDKWYYGRHEVVFDDFNKAQYPETKYKLDKAVWIH